MKKHCIIHQEALSTVVKTITLTLQKHFITGSSALVLVRVVNTLGLTLAKTWDHLDSPGSE